MFFARRPSATQIDRFLGQSRELPLSYQSIGIVRDRPPDGRADEHVAAIGRSRIDFNRARAALMGWKQFDIGWVEIFPPQAPVEVGSVVAVLIRHLGFWSLNGARVVYVVGAAHDASHFGFAYGTLPNHAESGEELFEVFLDPQTEDVMYRIRAVSSPQTMLTHIGQPIVRALQARFRHDSAMAMQKAVASLSTTPPPTPAS
jgi:uncharacterized protein (UPF0548 family)